MELEKFSDARQNTKMEVPRKTVVSVTSLTERNRLFVLQPSLPLK